MTTVDLGETPEPETSERSRLNNWVRKGLEAEGRMVVLEYEGFTVKNERISLLLDRSLFRGQKRKWTLDGLHEFLRERIPNYDLKCLFASKLKVPWYFVAYMYDALGKTGPIYVFELLPSGATVMDTALKFNDALRFANWLDEFRSLRMSSPYEESGLPQFDRELRSLGKPWPGNLDGVLFCPDGKPLFVVEFQTTNKVPVREHCNNKWFIGQGKRKGDEQRWFVVDLVRQQARLPLLILVWSPKEKVVKAKVVKEIVYSWSWDRFSGKKPGLYYSYKEVMNLNELINWLLKQCGSTVGSKYEIPSRVNTY